MKNDSKKKRLVKGKEEKRSRKNEEHGERREERGDMRGKEEERMREVLSGGGRRLAWWSCGKWKEERSKVMAKGDKTHVSTIFFINL